MSGIQKLLLATTPAEGLEHLTHVHITDTQSISSLKESILIDSNSSCARWAMQT